MLTVVLVKKTWISEDRQIHSFTAFGGDLAILRKMVQTIASSKVEIRVVPETRNNDSAFLLGTAIVPSANQSPGRIALVLDYHGWCLFLVILSFGVASVADQFFRPSRIGAAQLAASY